jgi:protein-S-isoprenylcysteine O-methyltransferase Ste14
VIPALVAVGVHAAMLAALGWIGGSADAPWLIAALLAWQLAESAAAAPRVETADGSARAIGWGVLVVVACALLLPGRAGWVVAGLALLAGGLAVRVWAIRTLGPAFLDGLALLPRHPRISAGPYRFVDHPGDLGLLVALVGVAAVTGSAAALGVLALGLVPLLGWRVRAEERLLARAESSRVRPIIGAGRR